MVRTRSLVLVLLAVLSCALLALPVLAAQQASTELTLRLDVEELETGVGIGSRTSRLPHLLELSAKYESGTAESQADTVWSGSTTVADGAPDTVDLRGSTPSVLTGDTISFAEVVIACVVNNSTTTGETITVGAGSNPWITWLGATGDSVVVGPSGFFCISSPIDGFGTTASTGDILTLTASSGDTISYDIVIVGRSN